MSKRPAQKNIKTVCVIGLWHLGCVNAVGFAEKGFRVVGIDFNPSLIAELQKGKPPLYEPGLEKMVLKYLETKKLSFTSDPQAVKDADYIVIAYDSPVDDKDQVNISPIVEAAKKIATYLKPNVPVIITSQVPLGSSEKIETLIQKNNSRWLSGIIYSPENLKLGSAIERFSKPDMLVLGFSNPNALKNAFTLYRKFKTKKYPMDLRSAEMVKHAINTFLATSIAFGNEIANLSDRLGSDAVAVMTALKADRRIGLAPVFPGLGFSGGTLARDIQQLKKFAKTTKYKAPLLKSIMEINNDTFNQIVNKLKKKLIKLEGKKIGILGLTYKPGTSTMRRSPAIKIINKLVSEGATCLAYDPKADKEEIKSYEGLFTDVKDINKLAQYSDALLLVTEWPEFKDLNYQVLAKTMKYPLLIDSKNYLDPILVKKSGFEYEGYGRGNELPRSKADRVSF